MNRLPKGYKAQIAGLRVAQTMYTAEQMRQVISKEREACAELLDANAMACHSPIYRSLLQSNADAIRARGQA